MTKFLIPPEQTGYGVQFGEETKRTQLEGGAGRYRQDILNSSTMVNVKWLLHPDEYEYLQAFYRTITKHGALPFTIDLIIDTPDLVEYTVHFIPGSIQLSSQSGQGYGVDAQLEVHGHINVDEETEDTDIIEAFETAWATAHP